MMKTSQDSSLSLETTVCGEQPPRGYRGIKDDW